MELKNLSLQKDGSVAILKINRPQALNALNTETILELERAVDELNKDDSVRVVIVSGEGKSFVAGADIAEMRNMDALQARAFAQTGQRVLAKLENMEKPVIAAINGYALGGGCELALACDIRIASEKAKLGQPEVGLGVIPGFAGTQRFARLCGISVAKEMIFTGDLIDARAALEIGLVNRVVADEALMSEALAVAKKIASKGPLAVKLAKTVINRGLDTNFQTGASYEAEAFGVCFSTSEPKEGMTAFLEKRPPKWQKE